MLESQPQHLQEEIKVLEEMLLEKKRALEEKGEVLPAGGDRELVKEVVKERVENLAAPPAWSTPTPPPLAGPAIAIPPPGSLARLSAITDPPIFTNGAFGA